MNISNCLQRHSLLRARCSIGLPSPYCKCPANLNALAKKKTQNKQNHTNNKKTTTTKTKPKPLCPLQTVHNPFLTMLISAIEGPKLREVAHNYRKYMLNQLRYHLILKILSIVNYFIQMTVYLPEV